jgi:hypothetical protein
VGGVGGASTTTSRRLATATTSKGRCSGRNNRTGLIDKALVAEGRHRGAVRHVAPNLLLRRRPEDLGLNPDGTGASSLTGDIIDPDLAAVDWTLARALRTACFWWIAIGYFCGLFAWYAVQVHQTKYLIDIGFSPATAAWTLGIVSLVAVPGQIGRERPESALCRHSLESRRLLRTAAVHNTGRCVHSETAGFGRTQTSGPSLHALPALAGASAPSD